MDAKSLDLSRKNISSAAATLLAGVIKFNSVMNKLNLDGFQLNIPKLRGTDPIETLDLSGKRLGVASGILIAKLIEVNGVMKKMNVRLNRLGDAGQRALKDAVSGREGFELLV